MKKKQGAPKGKNAPLPGLGRSKRSKVLIAICEGQTERSYLDRLNDRYGEELGFSVQLAPQYSRGQQYNGYKPREAVEAAVRMRADAKRVRAEVWAVFDRDDNTRQDGEWKPVQVELRKAPNWKDFDKIIEGRHFQELVGKEQKAADAAVRLMRDCPSGRCGPAEHADNCDVMLRAPSTDVDGILRSLGVIS